MAHRILDFFFGKDARIFDERGEVIHPLPPRQWSDWDGQYVQPDRDWHHHQGMTGWKEDLNLSVSDPKEPGEHLFARESSHPDWRRELSAPDRKTNGADEPWNWTNWLPWNWRRGRAAVTKFVAD